MPVQRSSSAGQMSSKLAMHCEPPLQSKRRSQGPTTSLSNGFYGNGDSKQAEYALLGNQDKFSENVKYRPRSAIYSRDISPPKQMKIQKKYKENRDPSPAPVVDTEQFRQPTTPLAPSRPKYQSNPPVQELKESNLVKEPKVTRSPKQSQSEPRMSKTKIEKIKNLNRKDPMKDSMKSKRIVGNMNEFAQTNMDKGVTDSAPEAPAEYALRYKTGISAPRPTKKFSEYQKQFQWKSGAPASPLLKAEQVIYNSNPQLCPPKKCVIPKVTEYQKQYKVYKLIPVAKEDPEPKKGTKLRRSKSVDDLSPADIKAAGSSPVISAVNKRLTLETDQIVQEPVPELPRKQCRNVRSEYRSNFKEPNQFDYMRGSWQGAAPPHVQIKGPENTSKAPVLSNWFAEVIELRRKAQEYRQRALGTHFSREHMAQLMSRQNDLWESSTPSARSTLSALSLESGLGSHRQIKEQARYTGRAMYSTAATLASEDDQSTARLDEVTQGQKKQAWMEQEEADENRSLETPSTFTSECLDADGRLPTPKIREQIQSGGSQHRRHHLDRTTPSVGGAILSSPPDSRKKCSGKRIVSRSVDSASIITAEVDTPRALQVHNPIAGQQTYSVSATKGTIAPTPTFGMPSRDTHALRDDDASTDRQLHTQFVYTAAPSKNIPGGLSAVVEGYGATYNKSKPGVNKMQEDPWTLDGGIPVTDDIDDDVLSVSMQSIASSCSLASDTLQRARKRKELFWGTQTVKAT